MKIKTSIFLLMATVGAVSVISCKKDSSTTTTLQQQEPVCEPVRFSSTPDGNRYIVLLSNNDAGSRVIQSVDQVRVAGSQLLRRYTIDAQPEDVLNSAGRGFIITLSAEQAKKLATDSEVQVIEKERIIALDEGCFSVVAPSTAQWGVRRTGVGDGTGKRVWIIDTGVDSDHPDLRVNLTLSKSFITGETSFEDNNGHGTHVAGIIGAVNNTLGVLGVAPGVSIIALKVLDAQGEGNTGAIMRALNYIGENANAGEVVNMSLGADTISAALDNAVRALADKGILFAIAAGNDAKAANLSSPARLNNANVFTVSAVDSLGRFAKFSNFGNDVVDYAAPGVDIVSTYTQGRYARMSGTSMAAPHMAGILVINGANVKSNGTATNDPDGTPDRIAVMY